MYFFYVVERGRLYAYLKNNKQQFGAFSQVCSALGLSRQTAYRYIDLYRIVNAFPRLMVCDVPFETIVKLGKRLLEHMNGDLDLAARLSAPLRTTHIRADGAVFSAGKLPGGGVITPAELLTQGYTWDAGWQLSDLLQKSTE